MVLPLNTPRCLDWSHPFSPFRRTFFTTNRTQDFLLILYSPTFLIISVLLVVHVSGIPSVSNYPLCYSMKEDNTRLTDELGRPSVLTSVM